MTASTDFVVNRWNLREARFIDTELPELTRGQVLLEVHKFALTANNITYGAAGETIGYWRFFPAAQGWGRIPVWGYATVTASKNAELPVGERIYGYLPISTHLIVEPVQIAPRTFFDGAAHRRGLPLVYNNYERVNADPAHWQDRENEIAIFRPLFLTSFLIDDLLADSDFFGAREVILTSASSKTALGLAQLLHDHRKGQVRVIGLTSPGNVAFVERTGYYDKVVPYAEVAKLEARVATVEVDFAGDSALRAKIHTHFGDRLKYSCIAGATHWQDLASGGASGPESTPLPGPKPIFFFAPNRLAKRTADWGSAGVRKRIGDALLAHAASSKSWMRVVESRGKEAIQKVYGEFIDGSTNPAEGHILSL
ncbi:MAG: DUF2855 family protein [Bauldia sp.]